MSLTLLIFRHAKSDFDASSDHERVLNDLGIQQAMFMGEELKEKSIQPDLVLCSSAQRAKQTMDLAMKAGEWECDSSIMDVLYNTTTEVMLEVIKQMSDHDKTIMFIGHEPTWSELVTKLTGDSVSFKTAGMCCIKFDIESWDSVNEGAGKLDWYESP